MAPDKAHVPLVNPVQGNPTATEAINGGEYSAHAIILGAGGQYKFQNSPRLPAFPVGL